MVVQDLTHRGEPTAGGADDGSPVVIIGAGPAGLTAAYELARRSVPPLVLEAGRGVGGLARTVEHDGFRFDIGGHRFFTKVRMVRDLWRSVLGDDLLTRPRLSRIFYEGRFFNYPLKPLNALRNLGLRRSVEVLASYLWAKLFPTTPEDSFADCVSNRFGRRLYRIFFKTYTEKVWEIPCEEIGAQWARQRIKQLSLGAALLNMVGLAHPFRRGQITSLIERFEYPRLGPGMMWEAFRDRVEDLGGRVVLRQPVVSIQHAACRVRTVTTTDGADRAQPVRHVISSMPLRELIMALEPAPPPEVVEAALRLKYRDFITVAVIVDRRDVFDDNWIYVHDESVKVGRVQNFKNWSPEMVPEGDQTCLGLEYFCFEGDGLWTATDQELVELASHELDAIGLVRPEEIISGFVVRVPKAYPIYDTGHGEALDVIKTYLAPFENLQVVGRNGMHKYNNQDHSMVTAILAVRNLFGEAHDLWAVNADDEYHEEARSLEAAAGDVDLALEVRALQRTQPLVPRR